MTDFSEHILLVNELNSDLHAGSDIDSLLKKACNRLAEIHNLHFVDSYFLQQKPDGSRYLKFSYSTLQRQLVDKIQKLTGIKVRGFEIPLFKGGLYEEIHDGLQPVEFVGKDDIIRVLEEMALPEKKLLRKLAPIVAQIVGSKYIFVIPLVNNNESIGQIGFNSEEPFSKLTKEALEMVVSKISNIIALKRSIRQIEDQNKELTALNGTKDKLFSILSHDLISPFNSILGYIGLIDKNPEELEKKEILSMVKNIDKSATHAYELVENLLHWSIAQRDGIRVDKGYHKLYEVVSDTIEKQGKFGAAKNIEYLNEVDQNLEIFMDLEMLKLLLRNLVSNAYKFTESAGRIVVSSSSRKNRIEFSIKDNGIGISKVKAEKIFQTGNFESTRGTNNETGTGLGLELCREIVHAHEGEIKLKSKEGEGSEFIISIPR